MFWLKISFRLSKKRKQTVLYIIAAGLCQSPEITILDRLGVCNTEAFLQVKTKTGVAPYSALETERNK